MGPNQHGCQAKGPALPIDIPTQVMIDQTLIKETVKQIMQDYSDLWLQFPAQMTGLKQLQEKSVKFQRDFEATSHVLQPIS